MGELAFCMSRVTEWVQGFKRGEIETGNLPFPWAGRVGMEAFRVAASISTQLIAWGYAQFFEHASQSLENSQHFC